MENKTLIIGIISLIGIVFMLYAIYEKQRNKNYIKGMPIYKNPPLVPEKLKKAINEECELLTTNDIMKALISAYAMGSEHEQKGTATKVNAKKTAETLYGIYIDSPEPEKVEDYDNDEFITHLY